LAIPIFLGPFLKLEMWVFGGHLVYCQYNLNSCTRICPPDEDCPELGESAAQEACREVFGQPCARARARTQTLPARGWPDGMRKGSAWWQNFPQNLLLAQGRFSPNGTESNKAKRGPLHRGMNGNNKYPPTFQRRGHRARYPERALTPAQLPAAYGVPATRHAGGIHWLLGGDELVFMGPSIGQLVIEPQWSPGLGT